MTVYSSDLESSGETSRKERDHKKGENLQISGPPPKIRGERSEPPGGQEQYGGRGARAFGSLPALDIPAPLYQPPVPGILYCTVLVALAAAAANFLTVAVNFHH